MNGMKGVAMLDTSEKPIAYYCEIHAHIISHFMTLLVTLDQLSCSEFDTPVTILQFDHTSM